MVISLITSNDDLQPPDTAELQEWADDYGQTFPVLSDAEPAALRYSERESLSLPSTTLLAPGAVVVIGDGEIEVEDIEAILPLP